MREGGREGGSEGGREGRSEGKKGRAYVNSYAFKGSRKR